MNHTESLIPGSNACRRQRRAGLRIFAILATLAALATGACRANDIQVTVLDAAGQPQADAVVYAEPARGGGPLKGRKEVLIEQVDKTFVPYVSVVQTGTFINFPNRDSVRHHVYSFSPAKSFEIKLFSGVPANPVQFDKPGEVVIGCNIHDQMIAHILVVDTPHFAKTGKEGLVKLTGLAAGDYTLRVWHPSGAPIAEKVALTAKGHGTQVRLAPRTQATPRK
ncbi:MAG: methylamine utilization protein [Burkholderiales bacterium]|nr:methylamine utilization protein [Burkholderiales bacterium]